MTLQARLHDIGKLSFGPRLGSYFILPGEIFCDWVNVEDPESRMLLRMFVNLTVYGKIAVLLVLPFV